MPTSRKPLPRNIRGGRSFFFEDPAVDKLVSMLLALAGEVWVLRERLAAIEGAAAAARVFTREDVERYEFSAAQVEQLASERREFIASLLRVLEDTSAVSDTAPSEPPAASARAGDNKSQRSRRVAAGSRGTRGKDRRPR